MSDKLDEIQKTQDSHSASLINVESTLEGYADAYKVNKGNIERLDEKMSKVEDQLDISVSPSSSLSGLRAEGPRVEITIQTHIKVTNRSFIADPLYLRGYLNL